MVLKRQKRREKELIKEVSAEMRESKIMEGEIVGSGLGVTAGPEATGAILDTIQTYVPPTETPVEIPEYELDVETLESYKTQVDVWKAEGYKVTRLENLFSTDENLFASTFPIFSSNISKLKNISGKLNTMDTTGSEQQVNSIKAKLFDPDQANAAEFELKNLEVKMGISPPAIPGSTVAAGELPALGTTPPTLGTTPELPAIDEMLPQLLPGTPTTGATESTSEAPQVQEPGIEQPEIPVSPFVEGQPQDTGAEDSEIPDSPFAAAQTQTLEEEMGSEAAVAEKPVEPDVSQPKPEAAPPGLEPESSETKKPDEKKES